MNKVGRLTSESELHTYSEIRKLIFRPARPITCLLCTIQLLARSKSNPLPIKREILVGPKITQLKYKNIGRSNVFKLFKFVFIKNESKTTRSR